MSSWESFPYSAAKRVVLHPGYKLERPLTRRFQVRPIDSIESMGSSMSANGTAMRTDIAISSFKAVVAISAIILSASAIITATIAIIVDPQP